jgi:Sulfotransferase domain
MPLKVIGAGQGRTGTHSLKLALNQLGFGPCHHMTECIQHPEQFAMWERVFETKAPVDWEEVFRGYRSTCDAPSVLVYRELAKHYPEAKVILTVRDPESWWRSVSATIHAGRKLDQSAESPINRMFAKARVYLARHGGAPDFVELDHEAAIAAFNRHTEEVRRVIPPERLLVYEANQGWEPLCKFLSVPLPATPFPLTNTTEQFLAFNPLPPKGKA